MRPTENIRSLRRPRHRYEVWLREFSTYRVIVEASTTYHAKRIAERLWEEDMSGFAHKDGGIEYCEAELIADK